MSKKHTIGCCFYNMNNFFKNIDMVNREKIKQLIKETGILKIESILDELKTETWCCYNGYDNKQKARDWFYNLLMGVSIHINKDYPESLFFRDKNGRVMMNQDYENNRLWIGYFQIWFIFESKYDLNDKEIRDIIRNMVSETFRINVSIPEKKDYTGIM